MGPIGACREEPDRLEVDEGRRESVGLEGRLTRDSPPPDDVELPVEPPEDPPDEPDEEEPPPLRGIAV
jgi:hypothetical protein